MALPPVAYYTSRMGFFIRAGSDKASYEDIVNALLKTDAASGLVLCTEATKPTTNNFPGKYIKCTDSLKHYYLDSTGSFTNGVYTGGSWVEDSYYTTVVVNGGSGNMIVGARTTSNFVVNNTTPATGKASVTFSTINPNQVILFDLFISSSCNVDTDWYYSGRETTGIVPSIFITVDGVDNFVDYFAPHDYGIVARNTVQQNASMWEIQNLTTATGSKLYRTSIPIAISGSHTASVKIGQTGTSLMSLTTNLISLTGTVSVT